MIAVPAGSFTMGSPPAAIVGVGRPQHEVTFAKPFAVAKFQATFADWEACVLGGGCNGYAPNDAGLGREMRPVIFVSWRDAQAYVAWLSLVTGKPYRLLSEAEYEYAARAGTTTTFPWGDAIEIDGKQMANCAGCGQPWLFKGTSPVGSFAPNRFGLYDMVGNVLEWTADCYHKDYNGAPTEGSPWQESTGGDCGRRIVRGGAWNGSLDMVWSGERDMLPVETRGSGLGFRVALTLDAR